MRPFERRAAAAYPYFKLAAWDARLCVWKAGKATYATEADARAWACAPGCYRITRVTEAGYEEGEQFIIGDAPVIW